MGALITALTEFSDQGNTRICTTSGHTASLPKLVIQKRKTATTTEGSNELKISVVHGTQDADSNILSSRVVGEVTVRYPVQGQASDISAVLTILQDIAQSDEFVSNVSSQNWLPVT